VRPHAQISIEEDAEVADAGRRQNKVFSYLKDWNKFPEISGNFPGEISGNFRTYNPS